MQFDPEAFVAGYQKEAQPRAHPITAMGRGFGAAAGGTLRGAGALASGAIGGASRLVGEAGKALGWTGEKLVQLTALLALVPPAMGAATALAASRMTSPSALDEEAMNALIEEQEVDRLLAETGRLTKAQRGKLQRDKDKAKNERSLYLG